MQRVTAPTWARAPSLRFPYIPRADGEEKSMLEAIGVSSFEDLLAPVPKPQ